MDTLLRKPKPVDSLAIGAYVVAVFYAFYRSTPYTILIGLGALLVVLGVAPKQVALAFLVGAVVILFVQPNQYEGFTDASGKKVEKEKKEGKEGKEGKEDESESEESKEDESEEPKASEPTEGFAGPAPMLPDNTDRREPLQLGKPYRLPNEKDDAGFHLDAGTTFLNAYKSLKPDQIAAMTRDTQELLATQKSLVAMLDSFGPLMKDMGKITGFLGPSSGIPGMPGMN